MVDSSGVRRGRPTLHTVTAFPLVIPTSALILRSLVWLSTYECSRYARPTSIKRRRRHRFHQHLYPRVHLYSYTHPTRNTRRQPTNERTNTETEVTSPPPISLLARSLVASSRLSFRGSALCFESASSRVRRPLPRSRLSGRGSDERADGRRDEGRTGCLQGRDL